MPIRAVDMNSRARSACYPQSTYYSLSDGNPTFNHRITKPHFRACSSCRTRSQAHLCFCTLWTIADRPEWTFGPPRYSLEGNRPSQTAHLTLFPAWFHRTRLESRLQQAGISPLPPPRLTPKLHRLPAILHNQNPNPISECSKGSGVFSSWCG